MSDKTVAGDFIDCSQTYSYETRTGHSCPSTPESHIFLMSASPASLDPPVFSGSRFFYEPLDEMQTEGTSPDLISGSTSFFGVSPGLSRMHISREKPVPKRTAPAIAPHRSKRARPTNSIPMERVQPTNNNNNNNNNNRVSLFKPCYVSRSNRPGFQHALLTPEARHIGEESRPCSPQSREIQRIMGRVPVTRPEACCFVPLSPCLPSLPRTGSVHRMMPQ